jgi:predicted Na+-dependent transporter
MNEQNTTLLIILGIPFITLIICWITLMATMHKTTGELKFWLTPDNVIKGIAIIFIVMSVLALAVLKILNGDVIATILSGIIGYTLGTKFLER